MDADEEADSNVDVLDILTFYCNKCHITCPIRYHCFKCNTCGGNNCKICCPDCRYWPQCARCSGCFFLPCNNYGTYLNDGEYYCDWYWMIRQHNEDQGQEPDDSSSASNMSKLSGEDDNSLMSKNNKIKNTNSNIHDGDGSDVVDTALVESNKDGK